MTSHKGRILCTEDDEDTRDLLVLTLDLAGYDVICTETATKALNLIRHEKFDLCLIDNWMPGLSGENLCKSIREFDTKTPILFYSGAGYDSDKARALAAGAQGYLVKPVLEGALVDEVGRIIAESKAKRSAHEPDSKRELVGEISFTGHPFLSDDSYSTCLLENYRRNENGPKIAAEFNKLDSGGFTSSRI